MNFSSQQGLFFLPQEMHLICGYVQLTGRVCCGLLVWLNHRKGEFYSSPPPFPTKAKCLSLSISEDSSKGCFSNTGINMCVSGTIPDILDMFSRESAHPVLLCRPCVFIDGLHAALRE